jgi:putative ABC transport system ATP-binding protein
VSAVPAPSQIATDAASDVLVDVRDLSFAYGRGDTQRTVLDRVCLVVRRGEIVLLTGPSGSGKTTLLTIVGGLRSFSGGAARVLGVDLLHATRPEIDALRWRLGFVFQRPSLLRSLDLGENVAIAIAPDGSLSQGDRAARSQQALVDVGLGDRAHDLPGTLSGGQQQRVAVARAMVRAPALVLADEPTASLDGANGRGVVTLMARLARSSGAGILLSTHDERIFDIADRRLHLVDGRLDAG